MLKQITQAALAAALLASASAHADISVLSTATFGGHTYQMLSDDTWTNSEAFAVSHGGHLVAVNSAAENDFISTTFGSSVALWIGLNRTAPGASTFGWSNGDAVTYTNFAGGEPNNAGGNEDYVHTYVGGQWNDLPNDSGYAGPKHGVVEITPVPEPESWAMMLAGLGLLGVFARRRKANLSA